MFGKITFGKIGSIIVKVIIIINNMGMCICYFRIFGEVVQTIVQTWASPDSFWVTNWHNFFYILVGSVIMFATIFFKKMSSLKKVSFLGVIAVLVLTITLTVLLLYKTLSNKLESEVNWEFLFPDSTFTEAFHTAPTVFLAFLFQFNVFPIYYSMKHRSMESMMKATKIGVGFSLIMFLFIGIIGFLLYGFDIEDTILDNLSDDMLKYRNSNVFIVVLIIIICVSFATTCLTSFPVLFTSLRDNYINSLVVCSKTCRRNNQESVQNVEIREGNYQRKRRHISNTSLVIISIFLYVFIVVIAIVVYKLKTMFTIVGASAGSFIAFILPNLFYVIIVRMSGKNYNVILNYILLAFGLFFFIIAILLAFF
jgi:amino acid permease